MNFFVSLGKVPELESFLFPYEVVRVVQRFPASVRLLMEDPDVHVVLP